MALIKSLSYLKRGYLYAIGYNNVIYECVYHIFF